MPRLSFRKVLTSKAVWGLMFATIGHDFCFYLYFNYVFLFYFNWKFYFDEMASATSFAYTLLYVACFLFAMLRVCCDASSKRLRLSFRRKIFTTIGLIIPPLCMLVAPFLPCRSFGALLMMGLALLFMGAYYSGVPLNIYDIAPYYSEKVATILNIFGTFQGISSAYVGAVFLHEIGHMDAWLYIFYTNLGICFVCWIFYLIFASGVRQKWDMEEKSDTYTRKRGRKSAFRKR